MTNSDQAAFRVFIASSLVLVFTYGVAVERYQLFPYSLIEHVLQGYQQLQQQEDPWYYRTVAGGGTPVEKRPGAWDGLTLITRVDADHRLAADIVDLDGELVHHWEIDWFELWPDATHLPSESLPRSRPGTQMHGAVIMPNGDLVFNFDHLGLLRLTPAGEVVWKLAYRTHHSVHLHDDGNLWVCGQREKATPDPRFAHRHLPHDEYTILEVSPAGSILREWSVPGLLLENGRVGLLHLGSDQPHPQVRDDLLHLNDVEPFPNSMTEGFFQRGDVAVSLRNINTVFVFNTQTGKIKLCSAGNFVGQHDPDFFDGDTITVFDNNTSSQEDEGLSSRIVAIHGPTGTTHTIFAGTPDEPFFTRLMGKHQWLPNGNLLITSSMQGKVIELDEAGNVVWKLTNYVAPQTIGNVQEALRIPSTYRQFYARSSAVDSTSSEAAQVQP